MDEISRKKKKFAKLYDKFVNQIYRFLFLRTSSKEMAEDLTSQVFLKGWEFYVKNEIFDPKSFFYQTARNLLTDYFRQKNKNPISLESLPEIPDPRISIEEKIINDLELEKIFLALSKLKPEYKEAILLRYVEGFSPKEVAKILEKSEGATRVLISRALKALKEEVNKINEI
jgi:RNA polymerase sigma-70 factor (ECF subfamily)